MPTISPGATIPKVARPHPKVRELRKDNEGAAKQELTRFGATGSQGRDRMERVVVSDLPIMPSRCKIGSQQKEIRRTSDKSIPGYLD